MTGLVKSSGTLRRVYGALLLVPVVALVWFDQMAAGVVLACLGCLMGLEIKRISGLPFFAGLIVLALIAIQSFPHWMISLSLTTSVGLTLMGSGLGAAIIVGIFSNRLAGLFVGLLCLCLASGGLLLSQPSGHVMLVALAAIIAACDSAAYFVGRNLGGPKLWPCVSPNKTISGSIGGLVAAMAVTSLVASKFGIDDLTGALIMGLLIGGLSQAGDLMESAVKRQLNVKDSGSILPGHGGILDRFDGYIFVIPAFYLYVFGL
ncbi:phosphatidate cytidylyltransferase [Candidatus Puniceispirillum sp.]|nr:phosphatidate cytidylyltransferase [Alphaproteobacteria bacterium]MDC1294213.1 phosphatidate cytidylyltransferase [Candidatus Puniceispirillum sp.]